MKILVIEASGPIETPERYRNKFGQLLEHSPFSETRHCYPDFQKAVQKHQLKLK